MQITMKRISPFAHRAVAGALVFIAATAPLKAAARFDRVIAGGRALGPGSGLDAVRSR
jgi:hypothetical protein